jgi:DNA-binding transcriptional ArsR family regulator
MATRISMAIQRVPRDRIILAIIRMLQELEDCDPSYLDFICAGQLSPNTVSRHLRALEYRGVLDIRRRRGLRNEYRINGGQHA